MQASVTEELLAAVTAVLSILYKPSQSNSHIPGTRSVTLKLRAMEGVAYTTGSELDNDHKEIHFSLDYILAVPTDPATRRRDEIQGVLVHEMVHCWQWNGQGTAPGGLIEGIADYVRLKAGLSPPHWKKEKKDHWDGGYQHTGYFLDWIESQYGEGSVRRINEALMNKQYDEEAYWVDLFGKHVKELWKEYCKTMPEETAFRNKTDGKELDNATMLEKEGQQPRDQLEKVLE
ncbi:MAG: hypothetical protein Q9169_000924 [Polycauliona sp. 2 TL-2023]